LKLSNREMTLKQMIAIDGPAASGKSTVAQRLAERLGYLYFDTGVMYRAATLAALVRALPVEDEISVTQLAEMLDIDVRVASASDGRQYDVIMDEEDVTWAIRTPQVDANVSLVSTYAGVRKAMTARQREIGLRGNVVMVGRDIGTVVIPEADLKIYLDASAEVRARRRYLEALDRGEAANYDEILHSMRKRDRIDSTRDLAPLKAADDAIVIDTTEMSIEEVFEHVMVLVG
jgi:cytidylate kinase